MSNDDKKKIRFGIIISVIIFSFLFMLSGAWALDNNDICEKLYNDSVGDYVDCLDYFDSLNSSNIVENITNNITNNITRIEEIDIDDYEDDILDIVEDDYVKTEDLNLILEYKIPTTSESSSIDDLIKMKELFGTSDSNSISSTDLLYLMFGIQNQGNNSMFSLFSQGENEKTDLSNYYTKEEIQENYATREFVITKTDNNTISNNQEVDKSWWIIGVLLILGLILGFYFQSKNKKEPLSYDSNIKPIDKEKLKTENNRSSGF